MPLPTETLSPEGETSSEMLKLRIERLQFELELARSVEGRLDAECRRLHQHIAAIEADRASLRNRLDERERYLLAVQRSLPWRAAQLLRGLVGRRW